ncbi:heavy metal translocating P-type ATPase [Dellaglioa carnosa]|uniref:heavy metal translocating P-type ATPase n=1 Tax=Dellaglioa carnosa TaxID=2995136 RepID=UPI0022A873C3|nr:heavy metal translocating P-type ATPase [Dellaglioa carnosa]MCZ2492803.1 heavy metal translocating P-type ATPase [Dellaglioa carnosa]
MQKYLLNHKNQITWVNMILIIGGFFSHFSLQNMLISDSFFILASLFGIAPILIQAYQALKVKVISIDLLVTIAVIGAFIIQNYEESAVVTFLFLLGALLEKRTLNKTRSAIKSLTELVPEKAWLKVDEQRFEEIDSDDVEVADILLVKTGGKIPVDGHVILGTGAVNESGITGESLPVSKERDAKVYAGTLLENGTLQIQADQVGDDTTFNKIIELVEEAQDSKSEAERFIDQFAKYYTPVVLLLAVSVLIVSQNLELAITILVLGCPGALVIGVPVSNVAGIGNGAKNGVLLKGSETIHDFSRIDTIVFDKTGTLTTGQPEVVVQKFYGERNEADIRYLTSVESESDHPLAKAVLTAFTDGELTKITETQVVKGGGIIAHIDGHRVLVGNGVLVTDHQIPITLAVKSDIQKLEQQGNSLILMAVDGEVKLLLGIRDQIRPEVKKTLQSLRDLKVKNLLVLSGDNQGTVDSVAKKLGLTEAHGNLLPAEKAKYIQKLQSRNHVVAFVGDGINDSPSLAIADIGIAMGAGTDVAIETSDVVLMNSDFTRLPHAVGLAKATVRNMQQNIIIALTVVIVLLLSVFFSTWMSMTIGMLVHEASILVVILNGMRLMRYHTKSKIK